MSRRSKTTGSPTTTDLERRASPKSPTAVQYQTRWSAPSRPLSMAFRYETMQSSAKKPMSTSRRSVAQATDSTRRG